ncbi:histidine--tRNA ligase [Metamycoplasma faucium]|uniref:Histidine--tRNA ligase n=1 Tax=Metamycoplasma faucium TaxID=56142 RepID=A0ABZ2TKV4_9BACT
MFNKLKGTRDIFGKTADIFNYIKNVFFSFTENYNYKFIETPIIEDANLFIRSAGETSDIVNKEMYIFKDNNQQLIALRPEATASTIRAYVQNKINNFDGDAKLYYFGPMFRYERPQKGRYRQFYQGGVELIAPKSSLANFEIIKLAYDFLTKLKINDFIIEINNLGSFDSRNKYILDLKKYFAKYKDELSVLSQERLDKNVLRIFDDKVDGEKDFVKKAPILWDYLSNEEKVNFNELLKLLDKFKIKYKINNFLVRGLDYYNDIVFEFVSNSEALGAKSTILAGGRYDGMIKEFGGPNKDSIGFAFGVDRLIEIVSSQIHLYPELIDNLDILIAYLNDNEKEKIVKIAYDLRTKYKVNLINEKITIKQLFKKQYDLKPKYLIFKELNMPKNYIKVKYLNTKEEKEIEYINLEDFERKILM